MARQGKCDACRVRWIWPSNLPLYMTMCYTCKGKLTRTNWSSGLKTMELGDDSHPIGTTYETDGRLRYLEDRPRHVEEIE